MTISAFYPVIFAKDLEAGLKEYEAMGFEGVDFFGAKGYKLFMGPFENEHARIGILTDEDGRKIFLYKHFRKEEREARAAQR